MTVTLKQIESAPAQYPDPPAGLSAAAAALPPALIWQRIEAYTATRFTARGVVWVVEGPGEWCLPLSPASITTVEIWNGDGWEAIAAEPSPLGYWLSGCGPYRFTASVGSGTVPAAVSEAYRRLAEYAAQKPGKAGASSESIAAGSINLSHRRSASWLAEAMQNSGAADLLRSYRRAA